MASSNQEWLQYYHQITDKHDDHHQAHAGDSSTPSKPIRRRSRASKKTPTTLLNANAKNFRALVQKFTGCPNNSNISLANQKGPVNLNFGLKNATPIAEPFRNQSSQPELEVPPQNHQRQQQQQQRSYFQENNNYNMGQDHQSAYSSLSSTMTSDVFFNPITSMNASSVTEMYSNGFVMDKDLSVNEFSQSGFIFD